jgi:hypothetical protein
MRLVNLHTERSARARQRTHQLAPPGCGVFFRLKCCKVFKAGRDCGDLCLLQFLKAAK